MEIGYVVGQIAWNILLQQVRGGDTIIYDRQWQGKADDVIFKKTAPHYGYWIEGLQGNIFKVIKCVQGDLTFFNARYDIDPRNTLGLYLLNPHIVGISMKSQPVILT